MTDPGSGPEPLRPEPLRPSSPRSPEERAAAADAVSSWGDRFDPVSRRTMLAVSTMLGLTGLYGLYAHLVDGLIEPPPLAEGIGHDGVVPPPRNSVQMAERYLAAAPWAANAKYQMRTKEAFVYFEEWKRVDEHEAVRFWPFAMVWIHNEDALREGPITIVSDSAFVKFVNKFEITNDPGRVVAAALEGNTVVRGPKGLAVDGRHFTYSESLRRIWSDEPLTFAHGRNSGSAVGMQVELHLHDYPGGMTHAVSGVRSLRLKGDVLMDLASEPGSDSPFGGEARESTTARITSDGPFLYDVDNLVATYDENVHVESPTKPNQVDTLSAEHLVVTFAPNPEEATPTAPPPEPPPGPPPTPETGEFRTFETNLVFRKLHASGPVVRLHSDEREVTALVKDLDYDGEARIVSMKDAEQVRVLHRGSELRSGSIRLVHAEEGGDLESLVCLGKGRMRHADPESGTVDLEAEWAKRMQMHPRDEAGIEVLDLEGDAVVRQLLERSEMQAQFLRLWFERREDAPAPRTAGAEENPIQGIDPRRLLALDEVTMQNPRLLARTKRLEVWFEQAGGSEPAAPATAEHRSTRRSLLVPPTRVARRSPTVQAERGQTFLSADDPIGRADARVEPAAVEPRRPDSPLGDPEDGPLVVDADLIRVRAARDEIVASAGHPLDGPNDDVDVREIWTFGNVHVQQEHADGKPPLDVTGDRMHVVNRGPDREVLHVLAREPRPGETTIPARVRDRGMLVEGGRIHLDREANRAWVEGPGLLQLPVEKGPDGQPLDEPLPLDVAWAESMNFDGRVARFLGRVRTTLADDEVTCAEMIVTLTRRLSFSEDPRDAAAEEPTDGRRRQPELKTVRCLDGVVFEGSEYEGSRLVSVRRGQCWQFDFDRTTGETVARGPGWVTMWRRGRGRTDGGAAFVLVNGSAEADAGEWEYTRVDFEGTNVGNVDSRVSKFLDRVEITHGPVAQPLVVIDPDDLPRDGGWMRSDELDLKQFEKTDRRPAYLTAFASGNVYLNGREFFARADEVAYDESKGRYLLRSKGDRQAMIWREKPGTGYDRPQTAKRIEIVPSRNVIRIDRAAGLGGSE